MAEREPADGAAGKDFARVGGFRLGAPNRHVIPARAGQAELGAGQVPLVRRPASAVAVARGQVADEVAPHPVRVHRAPDARRPCCSTSQTPRAATRRRTPDTAGRSGSSSKSRSLIGRAVEPAAAVGRKRKAVLRRAERALIEDAPVTPHVVVLLEQLELLRRAAERHLAQANQEARSLTALVGSPRRHDAGVRLVSNPAAGARVRSGRHWSGAAVARGDGTPQREVLRQQAAAANRRSQQTRPRSAAGAVGERQSGWHRVAIERDRDRPGAKRRDVVQARPDRSARPVRWT